MTRQVLFVCESEGKAVSRVRRVLDGYALRLGTRTWTAKLDQEALETIQGVLKSKATRQTSVACYVIKPQGIISLWTVGSRRQFNAQGAFAVATRQVAVEKEPLPQWLRHLLVLIKAAGYGHDLGKFCEEFAQKLKSFSRSADTIRHEWISLLVLEGLAQNLTWEQAWARVAAMSDSELRSTDRFKRPLANAMDVVLHDDVTHHRLLTEGAQPAGINALSSENHVQTAKELAKTKRSLRKPVPIGKPAPKLMAKIYRSLQAVQALPENEDLRYWRGMALMSRAILILADQQVSSQNHTAKTVHTSTTVYANTFAKRGGKPQLNQGLDPHLEDVSQDGCTLALRLFRQFDVPVLSEGTCARIDTPVPDRLQAQFGWQDKAADVLRLPEGAEPEPTVIFNRGGTGKGKTVLNVRAAVVVTGGKDVRISAIFNLRTLTTQTYRALAEQLQVPEHERACVLGMQQAVPGPSEKEGQDHDLGIDLEVEGTAPVLPEWLRTLVRSSPQKQTILAAPILTTTADFMVAAGDLTKQGQHGLAMMRVMHGALIIDEADSYEPKALAAVLQLVVQSAFYGQTTIISSATLSAPVAQALHAAFAEGLAMRNSVFQKTGGKLAFLHDAVSPEVQPFASVANFDAAYQAHTDKIMVALAEQESRCKAGLLEVEPNQSEGKPKRVWRRAIQRGIEKLHGNNCIVDPVTGKRVSVGVVKVANISNAVPTARWLQAEMPQARVACYHAQTWGLQRYLLEQAADRILYRGNDPGDARFLAQPEIREVLDSAESEDVLFVIVATSVEEVGRDHDFDWAVIEPSSAHSIVQMAGRVRRHRPGEWLKTNVLILRFNLKAMVHHAKGSGTKACFCNPGFESSEHPYPTHDMRELINWELLASQNYALDARLCLDTRHWLAQLEEASCTAALQDPLARLLMKDSGQRLWTSATTYTYYSLRERDRHQYERRLDTETGKLLRMEFERGHWAPKERYLKQAEGSCLRSAWLTWPALERDAVMPGKSLETLAAKLGWPLDKALSAKVLEYPEDTHLTYDPVFGFYRADRQ